MIMSTPPSSCLFPSFSPPPPPWFISCRSSVLSRAPADLVGRSSCPNTVIRGYLSCEVLGCLSRNLLSLSNFGSVRFSFGSVRFVLFFFLHSLAASGPATGACRSHLLFPEPALDIHLFCFLLALTVYSTACSLLFHILLFSSLP